MNVAKDYKNHEIPSGAVKENSLIHEFNAQLTIKSPNTKTYYENILVEFSLFLGKEWNELTVEESVRYLNYLKRVNAYKKLSKSNLNAKVKIIHQFLLYIHKRNIVNIESVGPFAKYVDKEITPPRKNTIRTKKETTPGVSPLSEIIGEFLVFLENNDYSGIQFYKKRILHFQQFLEKNSVNIDVFGDVDQEKLLFEQIGRYENMLSSKVSREEIILVSATI